MLRSEILRGTSAGIAVVWVIWIAVWIIASLRTKPVVQQESLGSRLSYLLLIAPSVILLLLAKRTHLGAALSAPGAPSAWLYVRFIRRYPGVVWIGAPLVLAGVLVALWARLHLAGNWSASVTLKQDHELILSGPYRYVRHPIYTGMLMAVAGTACAIGQIRGVLGFALAFFALGLKSRIEERLMVQKFGEAYLGYRAAVKGLIPFVF
ncbi:MAG: isoprenylcysteine carboxylmethyltransferase family protein [Steroidobacteraceae bacterium]